MAIPTKPPSGFRDFLPDACALRSLAVDVISRIYREHGFAQIATPAAEDLSTLTGKAGENEKLIFKILKRGEKLDLSLGESELADLGLRFDLTLPLARFYSRNKGILPNPFKAFQMGPVWRAERAQKGRYREFVQCDADIIGSDSPTCEIEVISAISAVFRELKVGEPTVVLNDRRILFGLFEKAGVPKEKHTAVCVILDKLDKVDRAKIVAELAECVGKDISGKLDPLVSGQAKLDQVSHAAPEAAENLAEIIKTLGAISGSPDNFSYSPTMVRGLDYYTGPIFEFRHPKVAGSVAGGGRYDRLTELFGGQAVPACGCSIGFERLMLLLEEAGAKPDGTRARACMTVFDKTLRAKSLETASALRKSGVSVDVYPGTGKLKAQFKYADSCGAAFALVIGPDEAEKGKVKAKDLKTGKETVETLESLPALLK